MQVLHGTVVLVASQAALFFLLRQVGSVTSGVTTVWSKMTDVPMRAYMLDFSSSACSVGSGSFLVLSFFKFAFVSFSYFWTFGFRHFLMLNTQSLSSSPCWQGTMAKGFSSTACSYSSTVLPFSLCYFKLSRFESNAESAFLTILEILLNSIAFCSDLQKL